MPAPILTTKLYIPAPRPGAVPRPHLIERLNAGLAAGRRLSLISAPAGSGKSSLVSAWIAESGRPAAWLSLEEGDGDPVRFLTYLVAALQTVEPGVGQGVLAALDASQPMTDESVLVALLNDITAIPNTFIFVLDDYHVIDARPVDEVIAFLIEHQPPQMHLVIATREDPRLPLARLRARSQLSELRAAHLRFTTAEVATFLNEAMGLNLTTDDIAALANRTEGWIAGLQLAALSLQGQQDVHGFIRAFAGDHRFIMDYLFEEVMQRQIEPVRRFLLQTSLLERA